MEPLHIVSELLPPKESSCVLTAIDAVGKVFSEHLRLTLNALRRPQLCQEPQKKQRELSHEVRSENMH